MRLLFYLGYALKTIRADRAYALLAVVLIAVGTGSLAATLSLGRAVTDNLTADIRRSAGGDVVAQARGEPFTRKHLAELDELKRRGVIEEFATQVTINEGVKGKAKSTLATYWFIDPETHPLYGAAPETLDPQNKSLAATLREGVVVSGKIARKLGVGPGDRLTFAADPKSYRVAGIVGDEIQPSLDVRVLGFIVRPMSDLPRALRYTPQEPGLAAKTILVRTKQDGVAEAAREIRRLSPPHTVVDTADSLAASSKPLADTIRQTVGAVGLLSLLITGVGVAFAARVWSRRRLRETAILKALGLPRIGAASILLISLALLSLAGAILAFPVSLGLTSLLQEAGRQFFGLSRVASWFYPTEWMLASFAALLATLAFSTLSLISLAGASPGIALRATEGELPARPLRWKTVAGLCSLLLLSGAAALILRNAGLALIMVPAAFVLGGVIILACALILSLLARIPFRQAGLKLALGSLRSRVRSAAVISLVVLVGILALGYIFVLAENLKVSLARELALQAGNDAMVIVPASRLAVAQAEDALRKSPHVASISRGEIRPASLRSIGGEAGRLKRVLDLAAKPGPTQDLFVFDMIKTVTLRDMDSYRPLRRIAKGRDLLPSDQGKRVIVVSGRVATPLGLRVGDRLELGSRGELLSFEIVGITERSMISVGDGLVAPMGSFPAGTRLGAIYDVDLQGDRQQGIEGLERVLPKAVVLDVSELAAGFTSVVDSLRIFPLMISLLALITSTVVIGSSVALAALGRRRELATLKALGGKRRRVLWVLTLEHLILGLVGGLGGAAIVWLLASLSLRSMFSSQVTIHPANLLALILLAAGVSVLAGLLPALRVTRERPAVALRYE